MVIQKSLSVNGLCALTVPGSTQNWCRRSTHLGMLCCLARDRQGNSDITAMGRAAQRPDPVLREREPILKEGRRSPGHSRKRKQGLQQESHVKDMCIWGVGRKSAWVQLEGGNTKVGVQPNDEISICVASKGKDAYSRREAITNIPKMKGSTRNEIEKRL